MKILLSPAKSMDFEGPCPEVTATRPKFLNQAAQINEQLRDKSPNDLSALMKISPALAELNYQRNQSWSKTHNKRNSRPAIFAFTGEVYRGFSVKTLDSSRFSLMQDTLRILSGQYGLLRPFDALQPYRLEMGTTMPVGGEKDLYKFWGQTITDVLKSQMSQGEILLNLASNEYAKSVLFGEIANPIVTPVFKEFKNGQYQIVSVYAKHARGLMTRYVIDRNIKNIDGLKAFNYADYNFSGELSNENDLVFTR